MDRQIDGTSKSYRRVVWVENLGGIAQIDPNKKVSDYQAGDHVGIFTLISNSDNEVLLGDSDKHLNVVVSVHK